MLRSCQGIFAPAGGANDGLKSDDTANEANGQSNETGDHEDEQKWLGTDLSDETGHPTDSTSDKLGDHGNDRSNAKATRKATPPLYIR